MKAFNITGKFFPNPRYLSIADTPEAALACVLEDAKYCSDYPPVEDIKDMDNWEFVEVELHANKCIFMGQTR